MTVWVVVYDSHDGHQIMVFDNEKSAKREAEEIKNDKELDRVGEWISCAEMEVLK